MSERVTHIGAYRIERELLRDEQRVVYQGWQMSLNRPVQITQLTPLAAANTDFVARWKGAARDLRDPGHPQLPRILDAQFSGEQPYLVESYIVADTLADQLGRGRDLDASMRLAASLADALAYAHKRGWAHGRMGAEYVRVMEDGSAYVVDLPWQASQRLKGDATAIRADVQALAGLLLQLRGPVAGAPPALTGQQAADGQTLAAWLGRGEPAEAGPAATALAPVLVRALYGEIADCDQLTQALGAVAPRPKVAEPAAAAFGGTIVTPPPGVAVQAPTPSPQAPQPAVAPLLVVAQTPPPMPVAPQQGNSRRGLMALIATVIILAGLAIGGYLLCQTGVLPFCAVCDESLIAQYINGARVYIDSEEWSDAQRELQAALGECATCRTETAACVDAEEMLRIVACHLEVEKLVAEGDKLLDNTDACAAVEKLQRAIDRAPECEADVTLARSALARNSDGGAYTLCAKDLLAQGETEVAGDKRDEVCTKARDLLVKAHELKPGSSAITSLYMRAEQFAAFRALFDAQEWAAAAASLQELEGRLNATQYCGYDLDSFRFDILMGQGEALSQQERYSEALQRFQEAEQLAQTLAQQNRVAEATTSIPAEAIIPTVPPTPSPIPALAAKPTPYVTTKAANIRACPSTNCDVELKAAAGTKLAAQCYVAEKDGNWYKVLFSGGEGWARADVLTLSGQPGVCPTNEITPTPAPPPVSAAPPPTGSQPVVGGSCRAERSLPAVTLGSPARDRTCNGPVRFSWQASYGLQSGEVFEVHIWPDLNQNRGNVRRTKDTSTVIDLRKDVPWINWNDRNRAHFWEIVVVCQATGVKVSQDPGARLFYFETRMPPDENNPDSNCR